MALSGGWKQAASRQALPTKWGTGANPVHAIATEGPPLRGHARLIAPNYGATVADIVPIEETDAYGYMGAEGEYSPMSPSYNSDAWTPEDDLAEAIWGYGDDTGTGDRPRFDQTTPDFRGSTELMRGNRQPQWGALENGIPAGSIIRAQNHGASVSKRRKQNPTETVSEGWLNKTHGEVNDADTSSPDQLYMQTSMTQRDKVVTGSQISGTSDEHTSPIPSRIVGMRQKVFSGGERHYDMQPRHADEHIRPWWSRTAGTGPTENLDPNAQKQVDPRQRSLPTDPYQGQEESSTQGTVTYGYVNEDVIPFA